MFGLQPVAVPVVNWIQIELMQLFLLEYLVSDIWKGKSQRFSGQLLNFAQSHLVTLDRLGR